MVLQARMQPHRKGGAHFDKGMRAQEVCHLGGSGGMPLENFSIFGALSLSLVQSEAKYVMLMT